jgi:hypothetical protein
MKGEIVLDVLTACRRIEDKRYITEKKNRFERLTRDD